MLADEKDRQDVLLSYWLDINFDHKKWWYICWYEYVDIPLIYMWVFALCMFCFNIVVNHSINSLLLLLIVVVRTLKWETCNNNKKCNIALLCLLYMYANKQDETFWFLLLLLAFISSFCSKCGWWMRKMIRWSCGRYPLFLDCTRSLMKSLVKFCMNNYYFGLWFTTCNAVTVYKFACSGFGPQQSCSF